MRQRNELTAPAVRIHPIDSPPGHVIEEKPSRIPDFRTDVLAATAMFAGIVFAGAYSFYKDFWPGGVTAILSLLFFLWRVSIVFDIPTAIKKETTFQDVRPRMAPPPRTIPKVVNNTRVDDVVLRNEKTLSGGGREYTFSGRQLDKMLSWVERDIDTIRREPSGDLPGLNEIGVNGTDYTTATYLLEQKGLIHKVGQTWHWTVAGKEWLK